MSRVVFLCNTPYQLIVVLQLKITLYAEFETDIILSDTLKNASRLRKKITQTQLFNNVYYLNTNKINPWSKKFLIPGVSFKKMKDLIHDEWELSKKDQYLEYLFANIGGVSFVIGQYLKINNKNIQISMYEDGISSYSNIYGEAIKDRIKKEKFLPMIFTKIISKIKDYYVYHPTLIICKLPFNIKEIKSIDSTREQLCNILKKIFEIDQCIDKYSEKIIFFEESYYADGINICDVELIEKVSEIYGKEEIFIKLHPRNVENRFKGLSYKTSINEVIPWEVLAFNLNLNNKILMTISSTAVMNSFLLLKCNSKIVFLYKCVNVNSKRFIQTKEVIERAKEIYPNDFFCPVSLDDI